MASKKVVLLIIVYFITISDSQSCRNRNIWPFSSKSVWNMPIGSNAKFIDSDIFSEKTSKYPLPNNFFGDTDYYFAVSNNDNTSPYRKWYNEGFWGKPQPYCEIVGPLQGEIRFPANVIVGNNTFGNNNAVAILQPDNITLLQMQPLYHCTPDDSPIFALNYGLKNNVSILGDGIFGCHGGSDLSSIGGTIRKGELTDNDDTNNIKHALKLEFSAKDYYYGAMQYPCYRWPAAVCDGYAHDNNSPLRYNGTNKWFTPGALLAVPSGVTLNLKTIPAKKIFFALQNYGGYICDDTASNRGTMCVEDGVKESFQSKYGYAFDSGKGNDFYNDLLAVFKELKIVINNNQTSIGGGGNPLQPLAPPICGA